MESRLGTAPVSKSAWTSVRNTRTATTFISQGVTLAEAATDFLVLEPASRRRISFFASPASPLINCPNVRPAGAFDNSATTLHLPACSWMPAFFVLFFVLRGRWPRGSWRSCPISFLGTLSLGAGLRKSCIGISPSARTYFGSGSPSAVLLVAATKSSLHTSVTIDT